MSLHGERIAQLEANLAELADIVRHLTWGMHGNDNLHNRGFEVADQTAKQAEIKRPEPSVPIKPKATGRKFR